jgi:hypothetical protein
MKLSGFTLAAIAAGTLFAAAAPAEAQHRVEVHRTVVTTHTSNNGNWHANRHVRRHKICRTRWQHHHRVTRCYWR